MLFLWLACSFLLNLRSTLYENNEISDLVCLNTPFFRVLCCAVITVAIGRQAGLTYFLFVNIFLTDTEGWSKTLGHRECTWSLCCAPNAAQLSLHMSPVSQYNIERKNLSLNHCQRAIMIWISVRSVTQRNSRQSFLTSRFVFNKQKGYGDVADKTSYLNVTWLSVMCLIHVLTWSSTLSFMF